MVSCGAFLVGLCVGGRCVLLGGARVRDGMDIAQRPLREASRYPQAWTVGG